MICILLELYYLIVLPITTIIVIFQPTIKTPDLCTLEITNLKFLTIFLYQAGEGGEGAF